MWQHIPLDTTSAAGLTNPFAFSDERTFGITTVTPFLFSD